jgi:hypothetical protein
MKALWPFKMSVTVYQPTGHSILEDWNLQHHRCQNLKSCIISDTSTPESIEWLGNSPDDTNFDLYCALVFRNQYSDYVTVWKSGVWLPAMERSFPLLPNAWIGSGVTQFPVQWLPKLFVSLLVNRPVSEVYHAPPYSAELKNGCSSPYMPL